MTLVGPVGAALLVPTSTSRDQELEKRSGSPDGQGVPMRRRRETYLAAGVVTAGPPQHEIEPTELTYTTDRTVSLKQSERVLRCTGQRKAKVGFAGASLTCTSGLFAFTQWRIPTKMLACVLVDTTVTMVS